jgi:hypothetical protein
MNAHDFLIRWFGMHQHSKRRFGSGQQLTLNPSDLNAHVSINIRELIQLLEDFEKETQKNG